MHNQKSKEISLDELYKLRRPYYILAPAYERTSAGVRTMHLLCHYLNQAGQEAYIDAPVTDPRLRTPTLTPEIRKNHSLSNRAPIAVYPEIVFDNPLNAPNIVRYILNHPGLISGPTDFHDADLLYFFNHEYTKHLPEWPIKLLKPPLIDKKIFFPPTESEENFRSGSLFYRGRATGAHNSHPEAFKKSIEISKDWPNNHEHLANLLRSAEKLYVCVNTAIIQEALTCNCPVVMLETPHNTDFFDIYRRNPETPRPGIALNQTEEEFAEAKKSISNFHAVYQQHESSFARQLHTFIEETQALLYKPTQPETKFFNGINNNSSKNQFQLAYLKWLSERRSKAKISATELNLNESESLGTLHLIARLPENDIALISETLDCLPHLIQVEWFLDIITPSPPPEGIENVSTRIGWHQVHEIHAKATIDEIVGYRKLDWIIELPPGAILDPLYFRGVNEIALLHENAVAFFVDDDIYYEPDSRVHPRFKPGVNPEGLKSTDLAGPLCVRRDAWVATTGASQCNGSPWFSKLLKIADKFGWSSIRHIPDTLISYTDIFPSDTEACLLALHQHLNNASPGSEILAATGKSWRVRYPLSNTPRVSIAVLSSNQPDLLRRCLESIVQKTSYPDFEIFLQLTPEEKSDRLIAEWITHQLNKNDARLSIVDRLETEGLSAQSNRAARLITGDFVAIIRDDAVIIQPEWLEELVRTALQNNIAVVAPRLIRAGDAKIRSVGQVLGLRGTLGSPYANEARLEDSGYLDYLQVARDVSSVSNACVLFRKAEYTAAGGVDENLPDTNLAWADLCLKLLVAGKRLLCQPLATVVDGDTPPLDIEADFASHYQKKQARAQAENNFNQHWLTVFPSDPFWNPNLSLHSDQVIPETEYFPQWQLAPSNAYRILARPLPNAQGAFRITSPLVALCRQGKVSECIWPMEKDGRDLSVAEISRLAPDTLIVQHYLHDKHLAALEAWNTAPGRPFVVYTLDDLISNLSATNPFFKNIPANSRSRLKYALDRCDRLVTSTEFLADTYRNFCTDIRVVPNRLEQEKWLPLRSQKRTTAKPRIGWAGGTTHQGDLAILKEVIEQTRSEADWIFFGMCPADIRPLLTEYHPFTGFSDYPARLASLALDIAVAPLAEHPFNQGKSNLRLLEYGILGIPVVCTDIEPYRNSPACCVANTTEAWIAALRDRIHNAEAREAEGQNMRKWVQQNHLLENHLQEWLEAHLPD